MVYLYGMNILRIQLMALLSVFLFINGGCQVADSNAVSNEQFRQIASGKDAVILDVRTIEEFRLGHIPAARNIDVLQAEAFKQFISTLPKNKTYLLYCRSGKRSATALSIMQENGFADVKHLQKGYSGWDGSIESSIED
jgi:rhodanese-related sulfurtransferase